MFYLLVNYKLQTQITNKMITVITNVIIVYLYSVILNGHITFTFTSYHNDTT